ncbi:MAG: polysaccharide deacetylase family protein [Armatimonadetes bacterium]|nr:polysaccharide deacetylase family protein [Armatimonadota bacterium]
MRPLLLLAILTAFSPQKPPGPTVVHRKGLTNKMVEDRLDKYWQRAQQEVYKSPEELQAQAKRDARRGNYLPVLIRGDHSKKWLALTFDDGPHPIYTLKLLDILKREKIPATFFVVGFMAEQYPQLIAAEAAGGHLIGNHTFSHVMLTHLPPREVQTEYRACNDLIEKLIGKRPAFCRPPGGDYDRDVILGAEANGLTTVLWTDDPGDYAQPGTHVIEQDTLKNLSNGGIILLHDGVQQTLDVLPQIIEYAKKKGYTFVTVDAMSKELLQARTGLGR